MVLYFSTGACSLHTQVALREAGLPFELVRVDLRSHKTQDGADYFAINPKGYTPALRLDDGSLLTEGAVIDQYVADLSPNSKLLPPPGSLERVRVQEWLHFIGTEIHKALSPIFGTDEAARNVAIARASKRFDYVASALGSREYLVGDHYTVADGYLFNMLRWTTYKGPEMAKWPVLKAYYDRIVERPSVKAAIAAERGHG
jgi:glutathione S-transferase